jgi:hypothetical protein
LPLGLAVLVAQRPRPNRFLFFWAIASVLTIAIYVPGIQPHLRAENLTLEDQVVRFLVWPIVLGAPIAGWSGVAGAFLAGLAALVFTTATGVFYARLVVAKSPEVARWTAWLGLTLFGIAGSFLIAFGRGSLGATYGLQERYITLASMAWLGLVPLIALHLERIRDYVPRARRILILVTCGVLVLSLAREYVSTIPPTLVARERRLSQLELMLHYRTASDAELISKLFPNESALALMRALNSPSPDNVRTMIEGLEAHHEGPFRPR